ncbi:MAG: hypothetical protein KatS3mg105_1093 [Gemmatales bacterium]|nr:MAG: hypothetical protein KatS3mg105_1093 [Gemmatales bacterium]
MTMTRWIKAIFRRLGLEIRRLPKEIPPWGYPPAPPWMHTAPLITEAEAESADHLFSTLANRVYCSEQVTLRRTPQGEDFRLKYLLLMLDVRDLSVLELGPYRGHHTFMLDKLGAKRIVAVEGREGNLRECEKVKERFGLEKATFVLQNIEELADGAEPRFHGPFDLVFCLGLLYHLPDPVKALCWCRRQAPSLFLGTHYVEPAEADRYTTSHFTADASLERNGQRFHGLWYHEKGREHGPAGLSPRSFWPYEPDLIAMLELAGYRRIHVLGRDLQAGWPHITILAKAEH